MPRRKAMADEAQRIEAELQAAHGQALLAHLNEAYQRASGKAGSQVSVETLASTTLFFAAATLTHLRRAGAGQVPERVVPWEVWRALAVEAFAAKMDLVRAHCTCGEHR